MMKRYLFIINPVAGNRQWDKVSSIFYSITEKYTNIRHLFCMYPGHATEIARENKSKYDVIIAVGGDGTAFEVVNGLGEEVNNILGVLPIGSGNDFARTANILKDFTSNLKILLEAKHVKYFDIPKVTYYNTNEPEIINQKYFINSLGIGFDAFVAYLAKENVALTGILRYLLAVFKALMNYKPLNAEAVFDNEIFIGEKLLFSIGNGKTSGGGFYLNPAAEPDDKFLNACFADNFGILKILRFLPFAVLGRHLNKSGIYSLEFKNAKIKLSNSGFLHLDGEVVTKNLKEISVEICENRLPIIVG